MKHRLEYLTVRLLIATVRLLPSVLVSHAATAPRWVRPSRLPMRWEAMPAIVC